MLRSTAPKAAPPAPPRALQDPKSPQAVTANKVPSTQAAPKAQAPPTA